MRKQRKRKGIDRVLEREEVSGCMIGKDDEKLGLGWKTTRKREEEDYSALRNLSSASKKIGRAHV